MAIRLSFVIPAFNEEKFLGMCLDSLFSAIAGSGFDVKDFEVIVVNNASTDNTKAVATGFIGVRVIDEPRKGLSQARQSGFAASSGELVANVDADCKVSALWIQTVLKIFAADQEVVCVSGPQVYYDSSAITRFLIAIYYRFAYMSYLMNRYVLRVGSLVQGGDFVVRRWAMEKIGGFNPAFTFYGEDVDIARRLYKVGKVVFTLGLPIEASGRRVNTEGLIKMAIVYPINYFWTIFLGRPFTKSNTDVRSV